MTITIFVLKVKADTLRSEEQPSSVVESQVIFFFFLTAGKNSLNTFLLPDQVFPLSLSLFAPSGDPLVCLLLLYLNEQRLGEHHELSFGACRAQPSPPLAWSCKQHNLKVCLLWEFTLPEALV